MNKDLIKRNLQKSYNYVTITYVFSKKMICNTFSMQYLVLLSSYHDKNIFYLDIAGRNVNGGEKQENSNCMSIVVCFIY